jgi:hypothetical protein
VSRTLDYIQEKDCLFMIRPSASGLANQYPDHDEPSNRSRVLRTATEARLYGLSFLQEEPNPRKSSLQVEVVAYSHSVKWSLVRAHVPSVNRQAPHALSIQEMGGRSELPLMSKGQSSDLATAARTQKQSQVS